MLIGNRSGASCNRCQQSRIEGNTIADSGLAGLEYVYACRKSLARNNRLLNNQAGVFLERSTDTAPRPLCHDA